MVTQTEYLNGTLAHRHDLNDRLCTIQVTPDSGVAPPFFPGQYVTLGLPNSQSCDARGERTDGIRRRLTRRAYSIASAATERGHLEFFIVRIPDGHLTPQLWNLNVGDGLWIDEKAKGEFTIEGVPRDCDLVMVSTGTGIGPFISILRTYHGHNRWRRFVMINGVREVADLGYRKELEELAKKDPTVHYLPIVSREPEGTNWSGLRGRVQVVLEEEVYQRLVGTPLDPRECHVFLCGNPDMVKSVCPLLEARGFRAHNKRAPGNIHLEQYW